MKVLGIAVLCFGMAGCAGLAQRQEGPETTVHVSVPKTVADDAQAQLTGMAGSRSPVLVLEGVELGHAEGLTIEIISGGEVLGSAGMVGHSQADPVQPLAKTTLLVPLNARSLKLLAGKQDVELTLRVRNNPARSPLKFDRVYFQQ